MKELFSVGDRIYGFCNGFFDRDDYTDKICVNVTDNYAVFQYLSGRFEGYATVLNYTEILSKEMVDKWKDKNQDY